MVLPPTLIGRIVQCPVPIPGEHDDFSFKCAYVESFGVAPFLYSVDGFLGTLPNDPCITSFG